MRILSSKLLKNGYLTFTNSPMCFLSLSFFIHAFVHRLMKQMWDGLHGHTVPSFMLNLEPRIAEFLK